MKTGVLVKKARLRLCAPRKKPNLANLKRKKLEDHKNNDEVGIYNILNRLNFLFCICLHE